jgi:hypothetical protein
VYDLNTAVETETLAASRTASLPEPVSLNAAWRRFEEDTARLRALEVQADEVLQKLTNRKPRSGWRRLFKSSRDPEKQALEARLSKLQRQILRTRSERAASGRILKEKEKKFQAANACHQSKLSTRRDLGEHRIATARTALTLIEKNPLFTRWGIAALLRPSAKIHNSGPLSGHPEAPDDWDLVPVLDIWGIPHLPRSKAP